MASKLSDSGPDIEQPGELIAYLRRAGWIGPHEEPHIHRLRGGVSNRTVLVERPNGPAWVLKQALPKLRVQVDWFSSPLRIHSEANGLRWLERLAPAGSITPLVFEDQEHHILGMQAVPRPHANWKEELLAGQLDRDHVRQFARLLGSVHRRACERGDEVARVFQDRSFFESLRLEPYYAYTAAQVPAAGAFLRRLIDQTRQRRFTLTHGDYSPKNVLVHEGRLILLDHEVVHFGDGTFDLGFSLTHLLSKAHRLSERRADFARAAIEYWDTYRDTIGQAPWADDLEAWVVRHTLGCLLARVAGRSPLEYLDAAARRRQREAVIALLEQVPVTVTELTERFVMNLDRRAEGSRNVHD